MKVGPVSGDLVVKLALALAVGGAAYYFGRKALAALPSVSVPDAINPASPNNVVYSGVNAVGGAIVTDPAGPGKNADGSWTFGGWLYDITH